MLFNVIKYADSASLIYLGLTGLFTVKMQLLTDKALAKEQKKTQPWQYFTQGLLLIC